MTFDPIEPDDAVYADYSANFSAYNAAQSGWSVETFSLVWRKGDHIAAGGRGHVYLGALELSGLWVDQADRGAGLGWAVAFWLPLKTRPGHGALARRCCIPIRGRRSAPITGKGYTAYARFDFPGGHARIDMQKAL